MAEDGIEYAEGVVVRHLLIISYMRSHSIVREHILYDILLEYAEGVVVRHLLIISYI